MLATVSLSFKVPSSFVMLHIIVNVLEYHIQNDHIFLYKLEANCVIQVSLSLSFSLSLSICLSRISLINLVLSHTIRNGTYFLTLNEIVQD